MNYTLYYSPGAASLALHWMLLELGGPFEAIKVDIDKDEQKSPEFLKVNPSGHLPALIVDGAAHAEVAAMLMLIAERDPKRRFDVAAGEPGRGDYLQRMFYLANTLQPAFRAWFYADEVAGPDNAEAAKATARQCIETAFTRLDGELADGRAWLLGERMTAVDFLAAMLCRWSRNMPKPATEWPNLKRYIDQARGMPSLIEVHRREGLTDWIRG